MEVLLKKAEWLSQNMNILEDNKMSMIKLKNNLIKFNKI
jgi:hypothetical protein